MRILFVTQSESLPVFEAVREELAQLGECGEAGFIVSDRWAYTNFLRRVPSFESAGHAILKEWEATGRRFSPPDAAWLREAEERLGGEAGLFGALVSDRRLWMGPDCTFSQDYRRRFDDAELLSILKAVVGDVEALFDRLRPDALVGFICVTVMDYVAYLVARSRGVAVLNLRPARVSDRVFYATTLNDPAPEFMVRMADRAAIAPYREMAAAHIARVRETHGRYEGVVTASDMPALKVNRAGRSPLAAVRQALANQLDYRRTSGHTDNHVIDPTRMLLYSALINPLRARHVRRRLSDRYVEPREFGALRYAFFPLHTEPEVSLLVYGRPFINQIEVVRALAMSLPADFVVLVKEHPWMVGKRSMAYYEALLNVPRVRLVRPSVDGRTLIEHASLVATITGSTALEAAILRKPVVTFGDCPYNALPDTMVRRVDDMRALVRIVRELLARYSCDDDALTIFLAAAMSLSESVHFYSTLLGKQGVHTERQSAFVEEVRKLAAYTLRFYREIAAPLATAEVRSGATW